MDLSSPRHPLHTIAVHFPIAFWISSSVCEAIAVIHAMEPWSGHALILVKSGTVTGIIALLLGILDARRVLAHKKAQQVLVAHGLIMFGAWFLYLITLLYRISFNSGNSSFGSLLISSLGCLMLLAGGWLGGRLVYTFGTGVTLDNSAESGN